MADSQALHILAHAGARKQDIRWDGTELANAAVVQPSHFPFADCSRKRGKNEHGSRAFFRRLSARIGKAKAVTATARKIAVLFYNTLRHGTSYKDPGANYYEERFRRRTVDNLRRRANALGFKLVESMPAMEGVS